MFRSRRLTAKEISLRFDSIPLVLVMIRNSCIEMIFEVVLLCDFNVTDLKIKCPVVFRREACVTPNVTK